LKDKVLILTSFLTSGHRRAAEAIEKAIEELFPQAQTSVIDIFERSTPHLRKVVAGFYFKLLEKAPQIWGYLYDNRKILEGTRRFRESLQKANSLKFKNLLLQHDPRLIVSTQAFSCGIAAFLKKEGKLNLPLIGVLTDFFPHDYWFHKSVDAYIVANEESGEYFLGRGVERKKIFVLGIPTDPKFSQKHNERELREKWGLKPCLPTLLVMGGGRGFGPLEEIVRDLGEFKDSLQAIVISGRNEKLKNKLEKLSLANLKVLGYTDKVDELMEISDLILTKPGGLTSNECLVKGLPMLIFAPIPGQEERNAGYLVEKGVALKVETKRVMREAFDLLKNRDKMSEMQRKALLLAKPRAALETARVVMSFLK
jgi:processive 1,2-diacylglycerol beta-glucosyltransferase